MEEVVLQFNPAEVQMSETPPETTAQEQVPVQQQQAAPQEQQQQEGTQKQALTPSVDFNAFVKETFGFDNVDVAKTEIEGLRKLKAEPPKFEPEFANESSKSLYQYLLEGKEDEAFEIISNKKQIEKLLNAELNDTTAEQIVKMGMKQKNKELTDAEIDFLYRKDYSFPSKPIKGDLDDDAEYEEKLKDWESNVDAVKMNRNIQAKMFKPELEKVKQELVLPKLESGQALTQAEIDAQKELQQQQAQKLAEAYHKSLDENFNSFNGFEVKYKDEDVEVPITFSLTDEDKTTLRKDLEGLNLDEFMLKRWFNEDGSPKVRSLMEDMALLKNKDAVLQKMVNETAAKVKENAFKRKANISLDTHQQAAEIGQSAGGFIANGNPNMDLSEQVKFLWSQK